MQRRLPGLVICCALPVVALLAACGGGSTDTDRHASAATIAPAATPPPADQAAEFRKQFEETQRRIEEERRQQEQQLQHRRSFVTVAFQEIDADGRVVVTVTNRTDRDIDDIRGGFQAEDADGNYLAATGFTEAVPGDVFLPAGAERKYVPYGFGTKQQLIERLRTDPSSVRFTFEAQALTYADGTAEPDLDG